MFDGGARYARTSASLQARTRFIANRELILRDGWRSDANSRHIFAPETKTQQAPGFVAMRSAGRTRSKSRMRCRLRCACKRIVAALQMIGAALYATTITRQGNCFADIPGQGYGFSPLHPDFAELLVGDDAKYSYAAFSPALLPGRERGHPALRGKITSKIRLTRIRPLRLRLVDCREHHVRSV